MESRHKHTAAGCFVSEKDIHLIIQSIALFVTFISYGAAAGTIHCANPLLSLILMRNFNI